MGPGEIRNIVLTSSVTEGAHSHIHSHLLSASPHHKGGHSWFWEESTGSGTFTLPHRPGHRAPPSLAGSCSHWAGGCSSLSMQPLFQILSHLWVLSDQITAKPNCLGNSPNHSERLDLPMMKNEFSGASSQRPNLVLRGEPLAPWPRQKCFS